MEKGKKMDIEKQGKTEKMTITAQEFRYQTGITV